MNFVLTVEGPEYTNKRTWTTHKVVGVYQTKQAARADVRPDPERIWMLTDLSSGETERLD